MSNQLENLMPKVLARGMLAFRNQTMMPRLVNCNFSTEAAQKGDRIDVMVSGTASVEDVIPGSMPPETPDSEIATESITLDHWKKVGFYLTDKDMMQIDADQNFIPFQMREGITALANAVNASFLDQVRYATNIIFDGNNKLFSNLDADAPSAFYGTKPVAYARSILNENGAPKEGRSAVLSFDHEAKLLALPEFSAMDKCGDANVIINGEVGRKYGIDWYSSEHIKKNNIDGQSAFQMKQTVAIGDETATLTSNSNDLKRGDIFVLNGTTLAGVFDEVINEVSSTEQDVRMLIPFKCPVPKNLDLTLKNNFYDNVIFQRDAFAFATSPLGTLADRVGLGNRMMSITDPETGLSVRLEISRQYKRTLWEFDILWGAKLIRPEWVVRLVSS